jgi:hypothetical protein
MTHLFSFAVALMLCYATTQFIYSEKAADIYVHLIEHRLLHVSDETDEFCENE